MTEKQCENCKFYDEDIDTQPCCSCVEKQNFEAEIDVNSKIKEKDIIKALELCKKDGNCKKCPLSNYTGCRKVLVRKALSLLCQKEATIETLKVVKKEQQAEIVEMRRDLLNEIYALEHQLETAKTEAYKEFADRVKEKASKGFWDELAYVDTEKIDDVYEELTERKED